MSFDGQSHKRRFETLDQWCEARVLPRYKSHWPCGDWFWCRTDSGKDCRPVGESDLGQAEHEKFRKEIRDAWLQSPPIIESLISAGTYELSADDYNLQQHSFRVYLRTDETFDSLGGASTPYTSTVKVKTLFGHYRRPAQNKDYTPAPITLEISMDETRAREFYAVTGASGDDSSVNNLIADVIYRLVDYRRVGEWCVDSRCYPKWSKVYKLLGVRLRVADKLKYVEDRTFSYFRPGQVILETIYEKPAGL
jgi:hypothetical protein